MLSEADRKQAAQAMLAAEREVQPCTQLTTTYPGITIEDAYAIQSEVIAALAAGRRDRAQDRAHVESDAGRIRRTSPTTASCSTT